MLRNQPSLPVIIFRKSYEKYGNWTLAAASYNGGRNGLDEQIEIQNQNNYYDLLVE